MRKWWNWQTHHLEGVAPKGVGVHIPPSAPAFTPSLAMLSDLFQIVSLQLLLLTLGSGLTRPNSAAFAPLPT